MARFALGVLSFVLLGACGSESSSTAGRYLLDQATFADTLADKLVEMGQFPAMVRDQVAEKLRESDFRLDLSADGTFTAEQTMVENNHAYKGTWKLTGTSIQIDQSHDNGAEVKDQMTGTLVDGKMTLTHKSDEGEFTMVLYHESSAAAPPR